MPKSNGRDLLQIAFLLRSALVERARRDFLSFVRFTKPDYNVNWHHELLARHLQMLYEGRITRLIVCMPPQHGKSELICRRFPAWVLGKDPSTRIIACTHTATLAEAHSRDVRRIMETANYAEVFPNVRTPQESKGHKNVYRLKSTDDFWELPSGGYFRAAGVGGAITGLRFDLGIIDDPIKGREEAESPQVRERVFEWYQSDFMTRKSRHSRVIVCMTRWHPDDLVGRILKIAETTGEQWTTLILPAICTSPQSYDPRKPGEPLWPDFMDLRALEIMKRGDIRAFQALYQQNPLEAAGTEWPASYFTDDIFCQHLPDDRISWIVAIDPSRGLKDKPGDETAIVALGKARTGEFYVDCEIGPFTPEETITRALDFYYTYRPKWIVVERNQYHGFLERQLSDYSRRRFGYRVPVWSIQNTEQKVMRIRRLGPYLANREIFVLDTDSGRKLVDQLREFPLGLHDDGPDALEMALRTFMETTIDKPEALEMPRRVEVI